MITAGSIRDQVVLASNPARLRVPAFRVIDRLEGHRPGDQLLGAAVAVIAMAEACELDLHTLMTIARSCMSDVDGPFTAHVQAIKDYAANELKRGGR